MIAGDKELVSIPWEEYKELLMIKGRYEELKERKISYGIDWCHKDSTSVPIRELNNPTAYYKDCPLVGNGWEE